MSRKPLTFREYSNKWETMVSKIVMSRDKYKEKIFLLVEGEADKRFFSNIIDTYKCKIESIDGKENVINAIERLNTMKRDGVLAIVDSDFDDLCKPKKQIDNLLTTDTHDVETLILKTDMHSISEKIKNEYGDNEKIQEWQSRNKKEIFQKAVDQANIIGVFKYLSISRNWNLSFKDLYYEEFIDENLDINIDKLITCVLGSSKNLSKSDIIEAIMCEQEKYHPIYQICCGHDITSIISLVLSDKFGDKSLGTTIAKYIDGNKLESSFRIGYTYKRFCYTELYQKIKEWNPFQTPVNILCNDLVA